MSRDGPNRPKKITVTCQTCGISESFYSTISVKHFALNHVGHKVVEGDGVPVELKETKPLTRKKEKEVERHEDAIALPPAPAENAGVKLPNVLVELVTFPALSKPVFRIRGIREDLEDAFVQVVVFEEGAKVNDILAKGQYIDRGFTDLLYVWDPEAVEYMPDARGLLGLPVRMFESRSPTEQESALTESPRDLDPSSVRGTAKVMFEISQIERPPEPNDPVFPVSLAAPDIPPPDLNEPEVASPAALEPPSEFDFDTKAEPISGQDVHPAQEPAFEPEMKAELVEPIPEPEPAPESAPELVIEAVIEPVVVPEPEPASEPFIASEPEPVPEPAVELEIEVEPASAPEPRLVPVARPVQKPVNVPPKPQPKPEEKKVVKEVAKQLPPALQEEKEDYLLVSKSWYIQEGNQNRKEAVRISKELSAFRWKIEPSYTIGVILDDILSIETSRNEISGVLVKRLESAGYTLSAVTVDQGKLVAWFKKTQDSNVSVDVA